MDMKLSRRRPIAAAAAAALLVGCAQREPPESAVPNAPAGVRLITVDPGHFHAALLHKEQLPGVSPFVHVYAPLGPDLTAHLNRLSRYNSRDENPTRWDVEVHASPDFFDRLVAERPGNVAVLSGRNRPKIARIGACLAAGLNVLADKPWIIEAADLPRLEAALAAADERGLVAYDAMTQRFEITCMLQRALVGDRAVFGSPLPGSAADPAVVMESLHYLLKLVSGVPSLRPAWFFDIAEQGEALADVGTHLVDLVMWILFPDQPIDAARDIQLSRASRWPTTLTRDEFERVTGGTGFPTSLEGAIRGDSIDYFANNSVDYTLKGIHVRISALWKFEAPPGEADTELAVFRGTTSRVEVRQGAEEGFVPQVYVVPNDPGAAGAVRAAVEACLARQAATHPGLAVEDAGAGRLRIAIPERYRIGHEAHFALLVRTFLGYLANPRTLPGWERPAMIAKYFVTTKGVELARRAADRAEKSAD